MHQNEAREKGDFYWDDMREAANRVIQETVTRTKSAEQRKIDRQDAQRKRLEKGIQR